MFGPRRLLPLGLLAAASVSSAMAALPQVDGWYPCSEYTFAEEVPSTAAPSGSSSSSSGQEAECATFKAPLCYDGVCDDTSSQQIDIFVKRIVAVADDKPNIFFMQGGPGAASSAMESAMTGVYSLLSGNVNVYTMDHRGTGRSTKLDCVAAQATTSASPSGSSIDPTEVPSCAADLELKYGQPDMAAFSVTSAANDLKLFISSFLNNSQTFVYGVSYGSSLVERLIHLNTTGIAGYVLDGISTTSGAPASEFEYFSTWDVDFNEVGQYFLSFCANDPNCGKYFPGTTVGDALKTLTANLDSTAYKCTAAADELFANLNGYAVGTTPPSMSLRSLMGSLLEDATLRNLIPVITYRLTRCNDDDIKVLTHLFNKYKAYSNTPSEDSTYDSDLVYKIIVYSEFWESPTPTPDEMLARFTNTTISSGSYGEVENYCVFTKDTAPGCKQFAKEANYKSSPLTYKKDKYWNVAASPPSDVSVLLMSSKMDPQTPNKYAERLYSALDTTNKELIVFEQATHATLWSTPLSNTDPDAPICGMAIVASYVAKGGDLSKMDKSCVAKMPTVSFQVADVLVHNWLNTSSAVDGKFTGTTTSVDGGSGSSGTSYKAVFIVFLVLFVLALLAAVAFMIKWRRAKKAAAEEPKIVEVMTPQEINA